MRYLRHAGTNRFGRDTATRSHSYSPYPLGSKHILARSLRLVSEGELVRRCILYEDASWQELIRRNVDAMYAAIQAQLAWSSPSHNGIEAEDILGRVFQKLLERNCEALRNLRDPSVIRPYLCQIARTVTVDYLREEVLAPLVTGDYELYETAPDPRETIVAKEGYRSLERALEQLSDRHRLFLRLYYQEKLPYKEIAELTKTPIRTVGTVLHRARKAARNLLKDEGSHSIRKVRL